MSEMSEHGPGQTFFLPRLGRDRFSGRSRLCRVGGRGVLSCSISAVATTVPLPGRPQTPEADRQHLPRGKGDYGYVLVCCSSVGLNSSFRGFLLLRQMMVKYVLFISSFILQIPSPCLLCSFYFDVTKRQTALRT